MAETAQTAAMTAALGLLVVSCSQDPRLSAGPNVVLTRDELLDPETCRGCHERHYREWSASMHAYAAEDPVFLAMNRRGQEETSGALGDFCVNCHAPMAVREGATTDGLNLAELPSALRGVTCYFCHNAASVEGTHNNPIVLDAKNPLTMRGGIADPIEVPAHLSEYSPLLASTERESSSLCGACHDIVLPSPPAPPPLAGEPLALERTFSEWQATLFAPDKDEHNPDGVSCSACHMPPPADLPEGPAAEFVGIPHKSRHLHDHLFPGVDVAIDPFPNRGEPTDAELYAQSRARVEEFLSTTLRVAKICVVYPVDEALRTQIRVMVDLDNVGAGHSWPSGAAQDRRAWVELKVFLDDVEQYRSGVVADGEDLTAIADPDLWIFRDTAFKENGEPAHMFWEVAALEVGTIPGAVTNVVGAPGYDATHVVRYFPRAAADWIQVPFDRDRLRVTLRVRIQPIGLDVLDDLIRSGHLAADVRDKMPTFTLLPNRALAEKQAITEKIPELARLSELSFEWSRAVMESGYFQAPSTVPLGVNEMLCTGMPSPTAR